jgi:sodium/hydrogen antiporter
MNEVDLALVIIGGLVLALGLFSNTLKRRTFLTEPLVALLIGIILGPAVLDVLDPARWGDEKIILEEAARLTLAIGLMAVALRLPPGYLFGHWKSLAVVLGLIMPLMWLASGLLVYLFVGLPLWVALLIGATVTPTDPIVATSIVTGPIAEEELPERLRHTISAESGANDGLAYPFLLLAVLFLTRPADEALMHWLTQVWLWEVAGAALFGALLGYVAGRLLTWSEEMGIIERHSFLAYTLALSLLTLGAGSLIGVEGIFAVFVAGLAFDTVVGGSERAEEEGVQEAVNQFFFIPIFALVGLTIPWQAWGELGWTGPLLAAAVLLLRRLPAVLVFAPLVGRLHDQRDALYFGWFGPIGVAALLYAMQAVRQTGQEEVWAITSLLICASVLAHGVTATPLTKLYGKRAAR